MKGPHFHACAVPGCTGIIPLQHLMCKRHWRRVPEQLQSDVWGAWEEYQCGRLSITDLREAQQKAIDAVVAKQPRGGAA